MPFPATYPQPKQNGVRQRGTAGGLAVREGVMGTYTDGLQAGLEGMPSPPPRSAPFCEYVAWLREAERTRCRLLAEHEERMRRLRQREVLVVSLASAFTVGLLAAAAVEFVGLDPEPHTFEVDAVTKPLPVEGSGMGSVTPDHDRR